MSPQPGIIPGCGRCFPERKLAVVPGQGQPPLVLVIRYSKPWHWWTNSAHLDKKLDSWLEVGGQGSGSTGAIGTIELLQKIALGTLRNGSCHFVWTLRSYCLFPGNPGAEGMLLPLILYFGIHVWEYPIGFLHSLLFRCSFWSHVTKRDFQLRTLEVVYWIST